MYSSATEQASTVLTSLSDLEERMASAVYYSERTIGDMEML
jgi:hypothetical protein